MYRPYTLFLTLGTVLLVLGLIPFGRFLWGYISHDSSGHIQLLIFGMTLLVGAIVSYTLGVIADLIRINRIILEKNLELSRRTFVDVESE